jgi:hypothetical protein
VLGSSESVEYLREPITQYWLSAGNPSPLVDPATDGDYRDHAVGIIADAGRRRLIKEVNPLLVPLLAKQPTVVTLLLYRHPCAVALSYHERGWTDLHLERRFGVTPSGDFWRDHGAYQALLLRPAVTALANAKDLVSYEKLTYDPEARFRELATRLGLVWDKSTIEHLRTTLAGNDRSDPYALQRDAARARDRWKSVLTAEQQSGVAAGYRRYAGRGLPKLRRLRWWSRA